MGVWNRLAVLKVVGLSGCFNLFIFFKFTTSAEPIV